jgi:hypothetical protein
MKKKVFIMFLLLSLAGVYVMTATAKGDSGAIPTQKQTAPTVPAIASPTAKPGTCKVHTGIDGGTVNLRECKGVACGAVLHIVTEGESLTIVTAGEYMNVVTKGGVIGWLNQKYCKEEK